MAGGGQAWRAVSVADGAARWARVPARLPGDAFGGHTVFAGGPVRLVSGYVGPALDIGTTVAGRTVTTTLAIGGDGRLDTAALRRALSARDRGSFATVLRVYDQSGHGNHITATPGRHVVHIGEIRIAGHETLSWGEDNGPGGFVLPDGVKVASDGFFFGTTGTYASANSGNAAVPVPVLLGQAGSGREFKAFMGSYSLDGFVHVADQRSPDQRTGLVVTSSPAAFGVAAGPGGYVLQSGNARATLPGTLPGGTLAGGYIGYNADGGPWFAQGRNTGQWTGIVIAGHAPTPRRGAGLRRGRGGGGRRHAAAARCAGHHRRQPHGRLRGAGWPQLALPHAALRAVPQLQPCGVGGDDAAHAGHAARGRSRRPRGRAQAGRGVRRL
ncbi:hypothetical protein LV478_02420 [Komagataeibacter oboediens]|uniref:hypothetical protein n=1 Tax=Komagataeibacter oboediens TaxID=65958 RepID=UPI0023DA5657|nr:hypothetical protein [Komagataeibacter oboediens]WEQ52443.1 hypothetical protein LV478_02420 [Komagataeibacter oboediens]